MGFAARYRINPVLMGLLIINGASAGGFSPMSIFGSIVNGVVGRNNLPSNPSLLFVSSFLFNLTLSVIVFFIFGGRELVRRKATAISLTPARAAVATPVSAHVEDVTRTEGLVSTTTEEAAERRPGTGSADSIEPGSRDETVERPKPLTREGICTLIGLAGLAVGALAFGLDVGFTALTVAALLSIVCPSSAKAAVGQVAWPTVLLICGIVTYVSLMERVGTIDWLGNAVTTIGAPLLAAIIICLIGALVSAFASTTGILGALIPLAVPFLLAGEIGAVGLIIALSISSSVVDSSPFSTSGALVVANSPEAERDRVFRRLMVWGFSMCAIAPTATWIIFVAPGWL